MVSSERWVYLRMYMYVCVCVCVCVWDGAIRALSLQINTLVMAVYPMGKNDYV